VLSASRRLWNLRVVSIHTLAASSPVWVIPVAEDMGRAIACRVKNTFLEYEEHPTPEVGPVKQRWGPSARNRRTVSDATGLYSSRKGDALWVLPKSPLAKVPATPQATHFNGGMAQWFWVDPGYRSGFLPPAVSELPSEEFMPGAAPGGVAWCMLPPIMPSPVRGNSFVEGADPTQPDEKSSAQIEGGVPPASGLISPYQFVPAMTFDPSSGTWCVPMVGNMPLQMMIPVGETQGQEGSPVNALEQTFASALASRAGLGPAGRPNPSGCGCGGCGCKSAADTSAMLLQALLEGQDVDRPRGFKNKSRGGFTSSEPATGSVSPATSTESGSAAEFDPCQIGSQLKPVKVPLAVGSISHGQATGDMEKQGSLSGSCSETLADQEQLQDNQWHVGEENHERPPVNYTTVMLRNVPNKYSREMLMKEITRKFHGLVDFVYLPIDFKNGCNIGYCFINFLSCEARSQFESDYDNVDVRLCLPGFHSKKVASVRPARVQGVKENVQRLRNSPVMNELIRKPEWMPLLLDSQGRELPFPMPEQPISPVRPRTRRGREEQNAARLSF